MKTTKTTKTKTKTTINPTFYCSQKFWWLSVNIEKNQTLSCCSATPNKIDLDWIKQHPNTLFNTPALINERQQMISGQAVSSCYNACWKAEEAGLPSRRLVTDSQKITHTNIETATPEILHIIVGSDCNMSCVYCCKQYSTSWRHDIEKNGPYRVPTTDDRYILNTTDKILSKVGQKDLSQSNFSPLLLSELTAMTNNATNLKISITGGEPFLYLNLITLIESIPKHVPIEIITGLGVNEKRFSHEISKLKAFPNCSIMISAENTQSLYEFTRFGNTWTRFENNIQTLKQSQISYRFNATITNLTIFDLPNFFKYTQGSMVEYQFCTDPPFLSAHVLDNDSRAWVLEHCTTLPHHLQKLILDSFKVTPDPNQIINFKNFLNEYTHRRNLSLVAFPTVFTNWLLQ